MPALSRIDLTVRKGCSRPCFVECSVSPSNLQVSLGNLGVSLTPAYLLVIHCAPLGSVVPSPL